jgi:hypothetical protein
VSEEASVRYWFSSSNFRARTTISFTPGWSHENDRHADAALTERAS